jgi:hypothetical protein
MTHTELCGNELIDIFNTGENCYGEDIVVRWCKGCGAIVVDRDIDGRTKPGDVMRMMFPGMSVQTWNKKA